MKLCQACIITGDPLHSRALAHSRAPLFTQPCPHCSHSRAPGEQWARLCVFTLQGCVQAARLCRGSPVIIYISQWHCRSRTVTAFQITKQVSIYCMNKCPPRSMMASLGHNQLTHWGWDKMATILHTTFSNGCLWMKIVDFLLKFHWSLFLRVQLTIFQHWFR